MSMTYNPSQLLGKRKKKQVDCPNPLFCQWLAEWRDEAATAGNKMQYTYAKALSNLRKYPVSLTSGKECIHLKFFGDKICKKLDAKLAEHRAQYGDELPPDMLMDDVVPSKKKKENVQATPIPMAAREFVDGFAGSSQDDWGHGHVLGGQSVTKQKTRAPSGPREYIPAHRSGPYALILTLYRNQQDEHGRGYMLKRDLINGAQPLCDKSLSVSDPGSHYTGFSSMGTLIKKGFVIKESSPAKYSLTETGAELARKILTAEELNQLNDVANTQAPRFVIGTESPIKKKPVSKKQNSDTSVRNSLLSTPEKQPALEAFGISPVKADETEFSYWYVTENDRTVTSKDLASVTFEEESIWFLIKCKRESLLKFCQRYKIDTTRASNGNFVYAYIPDEIAKDSSSPPNVSITKGAPLYPKPSPLKQQSITESIRTLSSQSSTVSECSLSSDVTNRVPSQPLFTLYPGNYDIILIVDNCEHYGQSSGKQNLLPDLLKNGVDCDVRKLHVGDFLWIAKEKVQSQPGQLRIPESRELVLDFVIERKRMDDLAGSIKDGRFKEQKFRMKHSGLKKPIYLVEEYGSQQFSLPEDTLQRSVINTQVIDGFFVKHTRDTKESVAYLTVMTRYLKKLYTNKKLVGYPREDIQAEMKELNIVSNEHHLMTFSEFNKSSVKNKVMSIKETFGKQLMQIAGMSAEKTQSILDQYKTTQELLHAYDGCANEKEKELLLSKIKCGALKRNLGAALSRVIYLLYNTRGPLS